MGEDLTKDEAAAAGWLAAVEDSASLARTVVRLERELAETRRLYAKSINDRVLAREEAKKAVDRKESSERWYAARFETLREWAKDLPEEKKRQYFNIVANGMADIHDPPTYARLMEIYRYKAETLERMIRNIAARVDRDGGQTQEEDEDLAATVARIDAKIAALVVREHVVAEASLPAQKNGDPSADEHGEDAAHQE